MSRLVLPLILAIGASFLPPGPLALLASAYFVFSTSYCITAFVCPGHALERLATALMLSFIQVAAVAELLSLFGILNNAPAWLAIQSFLWLLTRSLPAAGKRREEPVSHCVGMWYRRVLHSPGPARLAICLSVLVLAGNLLVATFAGVTVYDSVTTYVPYVIDFCQQGTLYYPRLPTTISSWHSIYAYTIVITDSMVMLNVLGWLSTVGAFLATLSICRALHLQSTVALICCTATFCAPQFVAQSANTMYDQVQAFGFAMLVLSFLKTVYRGESRWLWIYALSHASLMAMKLTWVFVSPVLLVLDTIVIVRCTKAGWRRETITGVIVFALALGTLMIPIYLRNLEFYGALLPNAARGLPHSIGDAPAVFLVRTLKCLVPYEAHYLLRMHAAWPFLEAPLFIRRVLHHVYDPYIISVTYFGILPLVLLLLLGYVSGRYALYKGKRRYLLLIAWSCLGAWILFQVTFALAFKYTPNNGRYMLICWPLSAVALAACIQCIGGRVPSVILAATTLICAVEATDVFLNRNHNASSDILNLSRQDHFHRDPRYRRVNIVDARRFLDERHVYEVHTDLTHFLRLQYYDALRLRRILHKEHLELDGQCALITNLSLEELRSSTISALYESFVVHGDVRVPPGELRVVLVPRNRRTLPRLVPTDFLAVESRLRGAVDLAGFVGGRGMGGIELRKKRHNHWLGPRKEGSLTLYLESDRDQSVLFSFDVVKFGIALPARQRHPLEVRVGGDTVERMYVSAPSRCVVPIMLRKGENAVSLVVPEDPSEKRKAGDPRPCMLYLSGLRFIPPAD